MITFENVGLSELESLSANRAWQFFIQEYTEALEELRTNIFTLKATASIEDVRVLQGRASCLLEVVNWLTVSIESKKEDIQNGELND